MTFAGAVRVATALCLLVLQPPALSVLRGEAQDAQGRAFDAASIKRRESGSAPMPVPMRMLVTPGRISFQSVVLKDCIRWAYGLADYQVTGGPAWIERAPRWDIEAKADGPATDTELRQMFRALLAERFGLKTRPGSTETRAFILSGAGDGPRLKRAADDAPRTDDWRSSPFFQQSKPVAGTAIVRELITRRASMRQFTEYLSRQLRVPVVDQTGLQGDFAFSLEWTGEAVPAADVPGRAAIPSPLEQVASDPFGSAGITAVREQLGLTLTSTRAEIDVLVIESVREASEN